MLGYLYSEATCYRIEECSTMNTGCEVNIIIPFIIIVLRQRQSADEAAFARGMPPEYHVCLFSITCHVVLGLLSNLEPQIIIYSPMQYRTF